MLTQFDRQQLNIYLSGYNKKSKHTISDFLNAQKYVKKSKEIKLFLKDTK